MPATPVKIGPFVGGLNTYSDVTSVSDNEFVDVLNFDIDLDGSLYSRAPFRVVDAGAEIPGSGALFLLGWFVWTTGERYLIASSPSGTYARAESTGVWTTITTTFSASCMRQYANKAWLVAPPTEIDPGGSWDPVANFVADPDIPKGTSCVVYKERFFIGGSITQPNRIYFSDPANFGVFQTTVNFFDARSGDGQEVVRLVVFQDTIVIFKENSTYAFAYDTAPTRGAVRLVNNAIGATNHHCVVEHENNLYVHHANKVYQIQSWQFTVINIKVPLVFVNKWGAAERETSLSIINDRLFVHHTDAMYVFNLRNATWTRWDIRDISYNVNYFIRVPQQAGSDEEKYYAGSRNASGSNRALTEWRPDYTTGASEVMDCFFVTKTYDFNVAHTFKRLFWWGIDMINKSNLDYTVHPVMYVKTITHEQMGMFSHDELNAGTHLQPIGLAVTYQPVTTHDEMHDYTHEQLHAGTHMSPTGRTFSDAITENIDIDNVPENRMFIKLLKGLRFRQIYFTIGGQTTGGITTSPMRIYSLTAFIDDKQLVAKKVS